MGRKTKNVPDPMRMLTSVTERLRTHTNDFPFENQLHSGKTVGHIQPGTGIQVKKRAISYKTVQDSNSTREQGTNHRKCKGRLDCFLLSHWILSQEKIVCLTPRDD